MAVKFNAVVTSDAPDADITSQGDKALITKGYADANYSGGGGGGTTPAVIQVTSTDTTTDINTSTTFTVPFNSVDFNTSSSKFSFNTSTGVITVLEAGTFWVYAHISYNDNGQTSPVRANPSVRVYKNGTSLNYTGGHGYLRNSTGHDEASNSIGCLVQCAQNDTLDVRTLAFTTATQALVLTSGESVFCVAELSGSIAPTGISANTSTSTTENVDLSNVAGKYYTALRTSGTITVASSPAAVTGGFAHLRVSYSSTPSVSGALPMEGATFTSGTEMKMVFYNDGSNNYYYFLEI
jgi:hypothetical protein